MELILKPQQTEGSSELSAWTKPSWLPEKRENETQSLEYSKCSEYNPKLLSNTKNQDNLNSPGKINQQMPLWDDTDAELSDKDLEQL